MDETAIDRNRRDRTQGMWIEELLACRMEALFGEKLHRRIIAGLAESTEQGAAAAPAEFQQV